MVRDVIGERTDSELVAEPSRPAGHPGGSVALVPRAWLPHPVPEPSEPVRLTFVGQDTYFDSCALADPTPQVVPTFVDFRAGAEPAAMLARVVHSRPHVVVVFRPEIVPAGLLDGLPAATVGFLTEPLPRGTAAGHPDLLRRLADLEAVDAANFDRIISFDPLIATTADPYIEVWRSLPLPVSDRFFAPVRPMPPLPKAMFSGRSTAHREQFLAQAKHIYDVIHVVHGVVGEKLIELLSETDAGINLHNEPYPSYEQRVSVHLAAGHLLISEPLSPTHGLEPGIDFLEVRSVTQLLEVLRTLREYPDAFRRIRVRGRMKAENFRASRVYPRLLHDLFADLAAFGTTRRATVPRRAHDPERPWLDQ